MKYRVKVRNVFFEHTEGSKVTDTKALRKYLGLSLKFAHDIVNQMYQDNEFFHGMPNTFHIVVTGDQLASLVCNILNADPDPHFSIIGIEEIIDHHTYDLTQGT